jgi:Zn-dependent peptidase ImmA (M78 family)
VSTTWGRLGGQTQSFAVEVRLIDDPDPVGSVDPDESASWGALQLWVNGTNVMAHREADETMTSLHWYLLPIFEWLVDNWDAILHEERLPLPDVVDGISGIEWMAQQRLVSEELEDLLDGQVRAWWQRHNLAVGALGSILPPTIIRRWGDMVEISMSDRRQVGAPEHVVFGDHIVERVPVSTVAAALLEVLHSVGHELVRRHPKSTRFAQLRQRLDGLEAPKRTKARLELLGATPAVAESLADEMPADGAVIERAPAIALLFGSVAPDVRAEDVEALDELTARLGGRAVASEDLDVLSAEEYPATPAGPMGSALGDDAWLALADSDAIPVDVEGVLDRLGVQVGEISLTDSTVRSVCLLSGSSAAIATNPAFVRGDSQEVRRFSLAHELCHLLFDRNRAVDLAIASGPWAPRDLERRANAFAAAFLMPSQLVERLVAQAAPTSPEDLVRLVANSLQTPFTSAVDRLRNLGVLTYEQADRLKQRQ